MIFPIGDDNIKGGAKPIFSYAFIAFNILIFVYNLSMSQGELNDFFRSYATTPSLIFQGEGYFTLATNMFIHGGIMHIAGNMLFLWIFADNIEAVLGNIGFLIFYISGGVFASFAHVFFNASSNIPSLGASGALAAVMGAYLIFFPKSKIKVYVIYLFRSVHISALYFLGIWFAFQLGSSLWEMGKDPDAAGTAWWAHIGGFAFGVAIAFIIKRMNLIDLHQYKTSKA